MLKMLPLEGSGWCACFSLSRLSPGLLLSVVYTDTAHRELGCSREQCLDMASSVLTEVTDAACFSDGCTVLGSPRPGIHVPFAQ